MIVIPKRGRRLGVWILARHVAVMRSRLAIGGRPCLRVAITLGHHFCAVDVSNGSYLGKIIFCSMQCGINRQEVLGWKFINPINGDRAATSHLQGWAGPSAAVTPDASCWKVTVGILQTLLYAYREFVTSGGLDHWRDR